MTENGDPETLDDVLDALADGGEPDGDAVALGELLSIFDGRAYGPLLLIPGLIGISPLGAIPGMSIATGSVIIALAIQMVIARRRPWLPRRALAIEVPRDRLHRVIDWCRPWVARIQRVLGPRLRFLVRQPIRAGVGVVCIVMGAAMFPLALVPFGAAAPCAAVIVFGVGLTLRDGVAVATGLALAAGAAWLTAWVLGWA